MKVIMISMCEKWWSIHHKNNDDHIKIRIFESYVDWLKCSLIVRKFISICTNENNPKSIYIKNSVIGQNVIICLMIKLSHSIKYNFHHRKRKIVSSDLQWLSSQMHYANSFLCSSFHTKIWSYCFVLKLHSDANKELF